MVILCSKRTRKLEFFNIVNTLMNCVLRGLGILQMVASEEPENVNIVSVLSGTIVS